MTKNTSKWHGMNWIRKEKRLAIYLRDGLACVYCGFEIESGAELTLDHLIPRSHFHAANKPVDNSEKNLVTCCKKCNSSRGDRDVVEFARGVSEYIDVDTSDIIEHVMTCVKRPLKEFKKLAKEQIALRGSYSNVMNNLSE